MIRFLTRLVTILAGGFVFAVAGKAAAADRPNIVWLTSEDNGPHYGCYGDKYATTPNIDALAAKGIRFNRAWSNAPVCAPARTCLISGRWAPSDGAEHMRSEVPMPQGHQMYPQMLREAGYYCTNNSKEDYNLQKPGAGKGKDGVWDESSAKAHWKNRKGGQPFFAVFNNTITHESQIRRRPHTLIHDPAKAPLPPFHPDKPEVRHDWAQYYDHITTMDSKLGEYLAELDQAGLTEDTIIMHYGDHGPGMPRFKRWPYDSGLRVGLVMYFPKKWEHLAPKGYAAGAASDELVSFIDLTATLLSVAGVKPPEYFHGRAICGAHAQAAPEVNYLHGFRGRMDERYDLVRSTTDGRYVYIRQYMPQLPYGQYLNYMFQQATTRVWKDLFDAGMATELQSMFWKAKPAVELYDLQTDPWETQNLAGLAEHANVETRLAQAQKDWLIRVRDLGFIPEAARLTTAGDRSPKDAFAAASAYPIEDVLTVAGAEMNLENLNTAKGKLKHADPIVRYWAVMGYLRARSGLVENMASDLEPLLKDPSGSVRIAAAEGVLASTDDPKKIEQAVRVLIASADPNQRPYTETLEALNVLDRHVDKVQPWAGEIAALPKKAPDSVPRRLQEYINRLHLHLAGADK